MSIAFQRWPNDLAAHYRARGYWLDRPLSEILDRQQCERPNAVALICGERRITYAEFGRMASNLAARLTVAGLREGDTALVQLPNRAEFYIVFFALLKIGVAPVNALFSHRKLELTAYTEQIAPRLVVAARTHELFADDAFVATLRTLSPDLSRVLLLGDETDDGLERWLASPPGDAAAYAPSAPDRVAFFQLSGGSTGTPKLIPRTHNDYAYSVRASAEICALGPDTRFLCALPAGHNFPLSSPGALGVLHAGGCVVLAPSPEPLACFALIARHHVTMTALVPTAVALWLEAAGRHGAALASLKLVQVGGANFAESLARRVPRELGCALQQVFGMAEGLVNYTRPDDDDALTFTTQGRPISPDDEIKIVDEDGNPVPEGASGLLATRGPYTVRGYYRSPDHNAKVFDADGFYYSGDIVQRVRGTHLRVVGRVKDQINRGGEKIAAEEIENLLLRHAQVSHAAVVPVQDALLGEKSCAFIVSRDPALRAPALRRHLLDLGVAEYKLPDRVRFVDALPLTAVGKIDKPRLRAQLA